MKKLCIFFDSNCATIMILSYGMAMLSGGYVIGKNVSQYINSLREI